MGKQNVSFFLNDCLKNKISEKFLIYTLNGCLIYET